MNTHYSLTDESHAVIIPGMAYLFRSKTTNSKRGTRYKSRRWYGRWKNASGKWVSRALSESKLTARKMLMKFCTDDELESIQKKPESLTSLLERFRQGIASSSTPAYARLIHYRAKEVIDHIEARVADHIEPARVQVAVAALALRQLQGWVFMFTPFLFAEISNPVVATAFDFNVIEVVRFGYDCKVDFVVQFEMRYNHLSG